MSLRLITFFCYSDLAKENVTFHVISYKLMRQWHLQTKASPKTAANYVKFRGIWGENVCVNDFQTEGLLMLQIWVPWLVTQQLSRFKSKPVLLKHSCVSSQSVCHWASPVFILWISPRQSCCPPRPPTGRRWGTAGVRPLRSAELVLKRKVAVETELCDSIVLFYFTVEHVSMWHDCKSHTIKLFCVPVS